MSLNSENYPYALYKGRVTTFKPSAKFRHTYFGGPVDISVSGIEHGPRPLHHVLTIWNQDIDRGIPQAPFGAKVPLLYGLTFEGCAIEYKRTFNMLEITKMSPTESSEDFPYPYYPLYLPYVNLEVKETRECSLEEFSKSVMQGIKNTESSELIVVVPVNPELRMSVWGPSGDAESVQIIFRCDTATGVVKAYNACT